MLISNMSKSGKSAYFHTSRFANNFFGTFFKIFFNGFDTHIEFLKKKFSFALISIFSKLLMQMRARRLKKTENHQNVLTTAS